MIRILRAAAALAVLALLATGCYRYTIISGAPNDRGTPVRLRLTDAGSVALAPWIGPQIETMDGKLVSAADTSLLLAVTETAARNGMVAPWRGEQVTVPRSAVARFERRTLDKRRSWIIGGIAAAAVVVAQTAFNVVGGGGSKGSGPGGRPD